MKLILPEQITATQYAAYLKDWGAERIVPIASANPKNLPFEEWRRESIQKRTRVPEGFVNETLYFLTDDNETKLFGAVDIRHELSERRHGYAKIQLALALPIARSIGIKKVLITCNDTNTGSAKTIESAGGVLENKVLEEGILTRRYWVPCADDFERKK